MIWSSGTDDVVDRQLRPVSGFEIDHDSRLSEHEAPVDRLDPLERRGISGVVTGRCEQHGSDHNRDQGEAEEEEDHSIGGAAHLRSA